MEGNLIVFSTRNVNKNTNKKNKSDIRKKTGKNQNPLSVEKKRKFQAIVMDAQPLPEVNFQDFAWPGSKGF